MLSNTEEKKRGQIVSRTTSALASGISDVDTTATLTDASLFLEPVDTYTTFAKIADEFIEYTGKSTNDLTTLSRAQLNSIAAAHASGVEVEQWHKISGNGIDIALKLMLSTGPEFFVENVAVSAFQLFNVELEIPNALFFSGLNIEQEYGVSVGDTIVISGATEGANNQTATVAEIYLANDTTVIVVNGTVIAENPTSAVVKFKSQFNTLPIGIGLKPNEVDVRQHLFIRDAFLPVFDFELFFNEIEDGKTFLEQQIYLPMACFSVPRKGRSSVVHHIAPLPFNKIETFDSSTVKNAASLKVQRSLSENFFNEINYQYDFDPITEKFKTSKSYESTKSKARLPNVNARALTIEAQALRTSSDGAIRSNQAAQRFLKRYQYGAEYIKNIQVIFSVGYALEIGDIVLIDFDSLALSNFNEGLRGGGFKLFEVLNKTLDNKTGETSFDVVNTAFGVNDRFGLISPASIVSTGSTTTKIRLKKSYSTQSYERESSKWGDYLGQNIQVRSEDFSTVYTTTIKGFDNLEPQGMLVDALPGVPSEGWIVEAVAYPNSTDPTIEKDWKNRHAFFSPQVLVTATVGASPQTKFEVGAGDVAKFFVGAQLRVHNYDYSEDAPEALVIAIVGNEIEIDTAAGFSIGTSHFIDLIGFPDQGAAYRIL